MYRTPCILEALRGRQRVQSNIVHGLYSCHRVSLPPGLISAGGQHAATEGQPGGGSLLVIRDVRTGEILHRWPLTASVTPGTDVRTWQWGGAVLAASCVEAGGIFLVNVSTGASTLVTLSRKPSHVNMSRWSSAGCLLVQQREGDTTEVFSVFDARGRLVREVASPQQGCRLGASPWAPSGDTVLLRCGLSIWLWDVAGSGLLTHSQLLESLGYVAWITWSFDSRRLLVEGDGSAVIWTSDTEQQAISRFWSHCLAWARHDSLILNTFRVRDVDGRLQRILSFHQVTATGTLSPPAFDPGSGSDSDSDTEACDGDGKSLSTVCPDGWAFCAEVCGTSRPIFNILRTDGVLLQSVELQFEPAHIRWLRDGASLAVLDTEGCCRVVLDFS